MANDKFAKNILKITVVGLIVFIIGMVTVVSGFKGLFLFLGSFIVIPAVALLVYYLLSKVFPDLWVKIVMLGLFVAVYYYIEPSWYFILAFVIFILFELCVKALVKNKKWLNIIELVSLIIFIVSLSLILDVVR